MADGARCRGQQKFGPLSVHWMQPKPKPAEPISRMWIRVGGSVMQIGDGAVNGKLWRRP